MYRYNYSLSPLWLVFTGCGCLGSLDDWILTLSLKFKSLKVKSTIDTWKVMYSCIYCFGAPSQRNSRLGSLCLREKVRSALLVQTVTKSDRQLLTSPCHKRNARYIVARTGLCKDRYTYSTRFSVIALGRTPKKATRAINDGEAAAVVLLCGLIVSRMDVPVPVSAALQSL